MLTAARIVQAINKLELGQLITTRQLLGMGSRGAIDQTLHRLVKSAFIVRVARGVFMKRNSPTPSVWEVAKAKAEAFSRRIYCHGADAALELGFAVETNQTPAFACSGRSSSFRFSEVQIRLVGISPRKLHGGDSLCGRLIRALWYLGKTRCTTGVIAHTYPNWSKALSEMHRSASALPHWMNNLFFWGRQDSRASQAAGAMIPCSVDLGELFPDFKHVFNRWNS